MTQSPNARGPSIAIGRTHTSAVSCCPCIRKSSRRSSRCCGRRAMFRISSWIAAAIIVAVPAFADRSEKTFSGTVSYEGGRVTIESRFGNLTVHTTTAKQVSARAIVRSSDAELAKAFRFNVSNSPEGVTVRTEMPSIHMHGDNLSWSADVDGTVPDRARVTIRNQFGAIEVSGLRAPAEIRNRQGSITARDIHGGEIETAFGAIN